MIFGPIIDTGIVLVTFGAFAWDVKDALDRRHRPVRTVPKTARPKPTVADEWARYMAQAEAAERDLLLASPTGWLLDPFRFPTDPFAPPPQQLDHHMGLWRLLTDPVVLRIDPLKEARAYQSMVLTGAMVHRPQAHVRMKISIPDCPVCRSSFTEIAAEHGGTASLYWCQCCHAEFTDKGETRKSKRRRQKSLDDVMNELPEPPAHRD